MNRSTDEGSSERRRDVLKLGAAALVAPSIAKAEADRVLRFIPQADLAVLDPVWTSVSVTRNHSYLVSGGQRRSLD